MISKAFDRQNLIDSLGWGNASSSVYDEAFVLRSGVFNDEWNKKIVHQIIALQRNDGSWGASNFYAHDKVINTLSVLLALEDFGVGRLERLKATAYLNAAIPKLTSETIETIGFELTFLNLLDEAEKLHLNLVYDCAAVRYYRELRRKKLSLLGNIMFSSLTTLSHSLEAFPFPKELDLNGILFPNGSSGNSPAATAAIARNFDAARPAAYLRTFEMKPIASIYPFEIFEMAWILYNFYHAGALHQLNVTREAEHLWAHWNKFGAASISDTFPIIDSDDTAVVFIVLKVLGYPVESKVFNQFEIRDWFKCFDLERNPSISANIHILEASKHFSDSDQALRVQAKIVRFLRDTIKPNGCWVDKWHISPLYCTAHAVLALCDIDSELCNRALRYILDNQREDGGWGVNSSSHEETFYALQALHNMPSNVEISKAIKSGRDYILATENLYVPLWVDKGLYCPFNVVDSLSVYA